VLAANGYPNEVKTGDEISQIPNISDTLIFHAGTKMQGALISAGGRVLTVTGLGNDLTLAKDRAYQAISKIRLAGSFYRRDIALNASIDQKAELVQK
jgi:phosphoribosylamine--glycine ligase